MLDDESFLPRIMDATVDGCNPVNSPVDMENNPSIYRVLAPSQVVVWDF